MMKVISLIFRLRLFFIICEAALGHIISDIRDQRYMLLQALSREVYPRWFKEGRGEVW